VRFAEAPETRADVSEKRGQNGKNGKGRGNKKGVREKSPKKPCPKMRKRKTVFKARSVAWLLRQLGFYQQLAEEAGFSKPAQWLGY